jgi:hypothetical protein
MHLGRLRLLAGRIPVYGIGSLLQSVHGRGLQLNRRRCASGRGLRCDRRHYWQALFTQIELQQSLSVPHG